MIGMYEDKDFVQVVDDKGHALPAVPKAWVKAGLLPEGVTVGKPDEESPEGDDAAEEMTAALEKAEAAVKAAEERATAAEKAQAEAEEKAQAAVKHADDLEAQLAAAQAKPATGTAKK